MCVCVCVCVCVFFARFQWKGTYVIIIISTLLGIISQYSVLVRDLGFVAITKGVIHIRKFGLYDNFNF